MYLFLYLSVIFIFIFFYIYIIYNALSLFIPEFPVTSPLLLLSLLQKARAKNSCGRV
nr:hypothetical protein SEWZTGNK_SEWZTGNK_CDS_0004 [Microvirus sp.]